jgi:hypothetical protein
LKSVIKQTLFCPSYNFGHFPSACVPHKKNPPSAATYTPVVTAVGYDKWLWSDNITTLHLLNDFNTRSSLQYPIVLFLNPCTAFEIPIFFSFRHNFQITVTKMRLDLPLFSNIITLYSVDIFTFFHRTFHTGLSPNVRFNLICFSWI